jgi:hypothetical protein
VLLGCCKGIGYLCFYVKTTVVEDLGGYVAGVRLVL